MKELTMNEPLPVSAGKTGKNSLMGYSMEIAILVGLYKNSQITADEFQKIKQEIMKSYRVLSDLTAVNA